MNCYTIQKIMEKIKFLNNSDFYQLENINCYLLMKELKMIIKKELDEIYLIIVNENFVKAHYKFEELWKKYKNDKTTREESFILKALVNASLSIELYKMNRIDHSKKIWSIFKKYEYLIDELNNENKKEYKKIQELIYIKKDKFEYKT